MVAVVLAALLGLAFSGPAPCMMARAGTGTAPADHGCCGPGLHTMPPSCCRDGLAKAAAALPLRPLVVVPLAVLAPGVGKPAPLPCVHAGRRNCAAPGAGPDPPPLTALRV